MGRLNVTRYASVNGLAWVYGRYKTCFYIYCTKLFHSAQFRMSCFRASCLFKYLKLLLATPTPPPRLRSLVKMGSNRCAIMHSHMFEKQK